jgi:hypothetical protein
MPVETVRFLPNKVCGGGMGGVVAREAQSPTSPGGGMGEVVAGESKPPTPLRGK